MSRSNRKTPVRGVTAAESEKSDKAASHRKLRRAARDAIAVGNPVMPVERQLTNPWSMAKDGKYRFDPVVYRKLMRK